MPQLVLGFVKNGPRSWIRAFEKSSLPQMDSGLKLLKQNQMSHAFGFFLLFHRMLR